MTNFTPRPHQQRMLDAMASNLKGKVICPTGGGKTFTMITDCRRFLKPGQVILQVAPQLMLSQQLFSEFDKHLSDVQFLHRQVSSEGVTFTRSKKMLSGVKQLSSTTSPSEIRKTYELAQKLDQPLILFTTYASLERVVESEIPIVATYFDEAHNCVSSLAFNSVQAISAQSTHSFFFTATPKDNRGDTNGPGMQNKRVYGEELAVVKFGELLEMGVIVKPRIHLQRTELSTDDVYSSSAHMKAMVECVEWHEEEYSGFNHKLLFCMNGTQSIRELTDSNFIQWANTKGYKVLTIDSSNKGSIDGKGGIAKSKWIAELNKLGENPDQKLIVLHVKMLGEGIDVKSFTGVVFLRRTLGSTFCTQTIGRVIRACPSIKKTVGIVTIVEFGNDIGSVRSEVQNVVECLLKAGVPPEVLFDEVEGRGKENEEVEPLADEEELRIRDAIAEWKHDWLMDEVLNVTVEDFASLAF
jgi:superfamily II DNA or RNA helicase